MNPCHFIPVAAACSGFIRLFCLILERILV